jgi:uncharacterized protein (DUF2461 family)
MSGLHEPDSRILHKLRQEIDYSGSDLHEIISNKEFKDFFGEIIGETLVRKPKGYDDIHPDVKLLKLKQYLVKRTFDQKTVLSVNYIDELTKTFKLALPFLEFLNYSTV